MPLVAKHQMVLTNAHEIQWVKQGPYFHMTIQKEAHLKSLEDRIFVNIFLTEISIIFAKPYFLIRRRHFLQP